MFHTEAFDPSGVVLCRVVDVHTISLSICGYPTLPASFVEETPSSDPALPAAWYPSLLLWGYS